MAIRRCPYCKAIIDEQDKYCNNCGTQLLFPEDEYVEEEIPGDRIVEEPEEEEQETEKLDESEELEEAESREEELEEDEEKDEEDEEEQEEEDKEEKDEEEDEEEKEEEEDEDTGDFEKPVEEEEEEIEKPTERMRTGEHAETQALIDELHKKYEVSIEENELVFKTKDLENLTGTVEEGKGKLEEFLQSAQKKIEKAVTPHELPSLFQEKEEVPPTTKEMLPPWAKGIKEEPPRSADLERISKRVAETGAESMTTPTHPEWATDSGIGIPEKVTQAGTAFGTAAVPATAEIREAPVEEGEEEFGAEMRQRARFSLRLKSKLVDLVFITALWLVSLWFTAQVIGVSFFRLIGGSPVPVLAFYFILLLLYFFLFLYFLGETLGDHYFSGED